MITESLCNRNPCLQKSRFLQTGAFFCLFSELIFENGDEVLLGLIQDMAFPCGNEEFGLNRFCSGRKVQGRGIEIMETGYTDIKAESTAQTTAGEGQTGIQTSQEQNGRLELILPQQTLGNLSDAPLQRIVDEECFSLQESQIKPGIFKTGSGSDETSAGVVSSQTEDNFFRVDGIMLEFPVLFSLRIDTNVSEAVPQCIFQCRNRQVQDFDMVTGIQLFKSRQNFGKNIVTAVCCDCNIQGSGFVAGYLLQSVL